MSSNFSFLSDTEPELCGLATGAEELVHESPTTALRELRTFGEVLVQRVLEAHPIRGVGATQHDRLVALEERGTLPENVARGLHQIRMRGNDASHENTGTQPRAQRQLRNAWIAAVWLQEDLYPDVSVPADFNRPEESSENGEESDRDRVKSEVEALQRRLQAVEGRQQKSSEVDQLKARIEELEAEKTSSTRSRQSPNANFPNRIRRLGHRGKQAAKNGVQSVVRAGRTAISTVYSIIRFIGRAVRRVVKVTALLVVIGALLMYLPSIYSAGLNLFPKKTTQSLPASKIVEEGHAEVFPPRMRTQVEEAVIVGWATLKREGKSMLYSLQKDLGVYWRGERSSSTEEK